jgi:hypothetical protein
MRSFPDGYQASTDGLTVKQRVFQTHMLHLAEHGMVACDCGALMFSCGCELCAATPPVERTIISPASCSICLERARASYYGTIHEVAVADLSYRFHEHQEQHVSLDYLTAQITVRDLRHLLSQLEDTDLPPTQLVTVFMRRAEEDEVADKIELGQEPDGPPSKNMKMGTCINCKQHKLLCGPYCVSCLIETYEDTHGPLSSANDLPTL